MSCDGRHARAMLDVTARVRELLNDYRQAKRVGPDASTSAHDVRYAWLRVEYETAKRAVDECPDCTKAAESLAWPPEDPAGPPVPRTRSDRQGKP